MQHVEVTLVNGERVEGNCDTTQMGGLPDEIGVFVADGMHVIPRESVLKIFVPTQQMPSV